MKRLKLIIWILALLIIEVVAVNRVGLFNSAPDLVFAFAIVYATLEEEYYYAVVTAIVCGICTGSICSESFGVSVLMYSFGAVIIKALSNKFRYITDFIKTLFTAFVFSAAGSAAIYFTRNLAFGVDVLWKTVLPFSIGNTIAAAALYPIVKKTMVAEDENKKLIPD